MTKDILISRLSKLKLEAISAKSPIELNISNFKRYRDINNTTLTACKRLHFTTALEKMLKSFRKTWSIPNTALNKQKPGKEIHSLGYR